MLTLRGCILFLLPSFAICVWVSGADPGIVWSSDEAKWERADFSVPQNPPMAGHGHMSAIHYSKSKGCWIAGCWPDMYCSSHVYLSINGSFWKPLPLNNSSPVSGGLMAISSDRSKFVALVFSRYGRSSDPAVVTSFDGIQWTTAASLNETFGANPNPGVPTDIHFSSSQNIFLALARPEFPIPQRNAHTMIVSSDGLSWKGLGNSAIGAPYATTFAEKLNMWVVVGELILTCVDPFSNSWNSVRNPFKNAIIDVSFSESQGRFVIVSSYGELAISNDGFLWSTVPNVSMHSSAIAFSEFRGTWIIVGTNMSVWQAVTSSNGSTWSVVEARPLGIPNQALSIAVSE